MTKESNVFWTKKKCPKCGSGLVSDGKFVWCSFVGGQGRKACTYGLEKEKIFYEDL